MEVNFPQLPKPLSNFQRMTKNRHL